jgi:AcrR family transcriptional regulator
MALLDVDLRTDATTERLVAAAAEVFAEKGYEGAGVAEIARRAGFTTGAIYSRFAGKAELLAEAIKACTQDEFDQLFAQHAFEGRATDLLATVGSHLVTREPQPGQALLLEAFAAARRNPEVGRLLLDHLVQRADRLAELVDDGKASGLVDPSLDTQSVVHFAHAVGLGFLLFQAVGADNPDPASWETVIRRVVESVVPHDAEPNEIVITE